MSPINALILTEGGGSKGCGHVARCHALAQAFIERGVRTRGIIHADDPFHFPLDGTIFTTGSWMEAEGAPAAAPSRYEIIVIDSYHAPLDFYQALDQPSVTLLCIDDFQRVAYPPGAFILNPAPSASPAVLYPHRSAADCLCGLNFALLRREFRQSDPKHINSGIGRIAVAMGGGSTAAHCRKLLELPALRRPEIIKDVIVGNPDEAANLRRAADQSTAFIVAPAEREIKQTFSRADIALSAGGQTLLELASLGIPTIASVTAENQTGNVCTLAAAEAVLNAGSADDSIWLDRVARHLDLLTDQDVRARYSQKARACIDGRGAVRAADICIKRALHMLLVIRPAAAEDSGAVFSLSNEPGVRAGSINSGPISFSEHELWFSRQLKDPALLFLVALLRDTLAGQIRFRLEADEATVSISVRPDCRKLGMAGALMRAGLERLRTRFPAAAKVKALIKRENAASLRLFERAGFEFRENATVGGVEGMLYTYNIR
jgi:UDP-2,4-diacetamido-2,4,6-trideoxy-beta-L-altropyranose hydrolase